MNFFCMITAGATPQFCSNHFVKIINSDVDDMFWLNNLTTRFLEQTFLSVGLKADTSVLSHLTAGVILWDLRRHNATYVFNYNPYFFKKFELFYEAISIETQRFQRKYQTFYEGNTVNTPVHCLVKLLANWAKICTEMFVISNNFPISYDKYFIEPISRIAYYLFKGVMRLRKEFGAVCTELKAACIELHTLTCYGLRYMDTHYLILKGVLKQYKYFENATELVEFNLKDFLISTLTIKNRKKSTIFAFKKLIILMLKFRELQTMNNEHGNNCIGPLTNELIDTQLLNIYNTLIYKEDKIGILRATLRFLDVLQRNLTTAECFTKDFLAGFLYLIIRVPNDSVQTHAAEIYTTISKRLQPDYVIVFHIYEVYMKILPTKNFRLSTFLDNFNKYINKLGRFFPAIFNLTFYTEILFNYHSNHTLCILTSHAAVIIFKMHKDKVATIHPLSGEFVLFLTNLPNVMKKLDTTTISILIQILAEIDHARILNHVNNGREILTNLEKYCAHNFLNDYNIDVLFATFLYKSLMMSVQHTGNNEMIRNIADKLFHEFSELHQYAKNLMPSETMDLSDVRLIKYGVVINRIKIVFQMDPNIPQNYPERELIFGILIECYFPTERFKLINTENVQYRFDFEAYELIATIAIIRQNLDTERIFEFLSELAYFMFINLITVQPKETYQCYALYCTMISLFVAFSKPTVHGWLKLEAHIYNLFVSVLHRTLEETESSNSNQNYDYTLIMLDAFEYFFTSLQITEPSSIIWKLICHYNMTDDERLNSKLRHLCILYLCKHVNHYAHVLPVAVYHIHYTDPKLTQRQIANILKGHIQIIDEYQPENVAITLKLTTFLVTLEVLSKNLTVIEPSEDKNRILPLTNLMLFINSVPLTVQDLIDINYLIVQIKFQQLNREERELIQKFEHSIIALNAQFDSLPSTAPTTN